MEDNSTRETFQKTISFAGSVPEFLAGLGEKERSLDWLEKAYGERCVELALLKVDQRFDNLRADSHFADLMLRVGLTP